MLLHYEYWSVILSSPSNLVQLSVYCAVRILSSFWNQCCHMPQRLSHNLVLLDSIHLLSFDPLLCQMRLWYNSCSYKVQASWIDWWHYLSLSIGCSELIRDKILQWTTLMSSSLDSAYRFCCCIGGNVLFLKQWSTFIILTTHSFIVSFTGCQSMNKPT